MDKFSTTFSDFFCSFMSLVERESCVLCLFIFLVELCYNHLLESPIAVVLVGKAKGEVVVEIRAHQGHRSQEVSQEDSKRMPSVEKLSRELGGLGIKEPNQTRERSKLDKVKLERMRQLLEKTSKQKLDGCQEEVEVVKFRSLRLPDHKKIFLCPLPDCHFSIDRRGIRSKGAEMHLEVDHGFKVETNPKLLLQGSSASSSYRCPFLPCSFLTSKLGMYSGHAVIHVVNEHKVTLDDVRRKVRFVRISKETGDQEEQLEQQIKMLNI